MDQPSSEPAQTAQPAQPEPQATAPSAPAAQTTTSKPVHSLVIDANAIIRNDPTVSSLLAQAEELYTIPAVVSEIRDEATRSRFQTTLSPFLKLRTPRPESVKFVTDFARKTGDLQVLSKPDLHLLALTYDLEIERNGGDWRLRRDPNQKRVNGQPAEKEEGKGEEAEPGSSEAKPPQDEADAEDSPSPGPENKKDAAPEPTTASPTGADQAEGSLAAQVQDLSLQDSDGQDGQEAAEGEKKKEEEDDDDDDDDEDEATEEEDDGGGEWITPSNIKKYRARENALVDDQPAQKVLQAALLTADMAMRNVALRMNLNLLDSGFARITYLRTWVLRCHGCFKVCKDTSKQFCPSCGQATLTRVSCSTDASGNFTLHLKKNFQYIKRGNVYSIPKPTHGSANGRVKGGGKNGWGNELILAADQKEYLKKLDDQRRTKASDLMDEDYLPGILGGTRTSSGGRIRVGAGRNVNAPKKRR
ncbi:hypothetical protein VTJ83DRAFT_1844 [Remersonia thermophila]|uniref:20S-pre-rRNA D-site endonuclease NOB1 n=1 Tax=Remersonia thermophila TaxID=72144 RepID=A0ABR4DH18_9PEZI